MCKMCPDNQASSALPSTMAFYFSLFGFRLLFSVGREASTSLNDDVCFFPLYDTPKPGTSLWGRGWVLRQFMLGRGLQSGDRRGRGFY